MTDRIRALLKDRNLVPFNIDSIADDADLYEAGLTSFGSVQLMLGLEEAFDIEFPERMLTRRTFATIAAISAAVDELASEKV
ncbi:acyl carrier protein [Methyloraptor flagellatus]|jgi:acyl carrier protein|uniref:Acyl carrier protein n=1 Tax=Methyloraptor flagellatus TaxID=3162530 RepID=A0AAU7X779_9HYPH